MIEQTFEMEDSKYRLLEQQLRDKDEELEKIQTLNQELDHKL